MTPAAAEGPGQPLAPPQVLAWVQEQPLAPPQVLALVQEPVPPVTTGAQVSTLTCLLCFPGCSSS